jgi:hypothetical protein
MRSSPGNPRFASRGKQAAVFPLVRGISGQFRQTRFHG